ncbi:uncharacterized protein N7515_001154 [Penicillium bovifimosum]|uniref:Uncharacterized protein n=1 Tax=Penicillium bovifimosum TaxID=126998 RepID=A0A9W9LC30_9EURO|nr:uncharacterized protein N7515_001154 [Penicillium bovifimosum]KAJ5146590.1 hypothetical protein N7515_001154 [Penicillium bovifimosum]
MNKVLREGGINTGPITRPVPPQFVALLQHEDLEVMPGYSKVYLLKTDINPRSEAYPVSLRLKRGGRVTTVEEEEPQHHRIEDGTLRRDHEEIPVKAEIPRAMPIPPRPSETTSPTGDHDPSGTLPPGRLMLNTCFHLGIAPGQFHAVFPMILTGNEEEFYLHNIDRRDDFRTQYMKLKSHFDTTVNHEHYFTEWTTISFMKVREENPEKSLHEVLQILLDKMRRCQRALGPDYEGEHQLHTSVIKACRGVSELEHALYKPAKTCEQLFSDLRSSIETSLVRKQSANYMVDGNSQFYLDRKYKKNGNSSRGAFQGHRGTGSRYRDEHPGQRRGWRKKCFVCQKEGCRSTRHSPEERRNAKSQFLMHAEFTGSTGDSFTAYLTEFEGHESDDDPVSDYDDEDNENQVLASVHLTNRAFIHRMTGEDAFTETASQPASQFMRIRLQHKIVNGPESV